MSRGLVLSALIAVVLTAACVHASSERQAKLWQLRGSVVSLTDNEMKVHHKSGVLFVLKLDEDTEYYLNEHLDTKQSVHVGTRVTVDVLMLATGENHARRVSVFRH